MRCWPRSVISRASNSAHVSGWAVDSLDGDWTLFFVGVARDVDTCDPTALAFGPPAALTGESSGRVLIYRVLNTINTRRA